MKTIGLFLILALAASALPAADLTNAGQVYYAITLLTNRCNAGGIVFSHRSGVAKIDFRDLDEANRSRFGFDSDRYASFKEEEARRHPESPPPPPVVTVHSSPPPRIVRRIIVVTNSVPAPAPFGSPASTIEPDHQKMNRYRLKAIEKAIEINNHRPPTRPHHD